MISRDTIQRGFPIKPLGEVAEFLDSRRRPITASERIPGPYPYYGANGQQDSVADYIFDESLILLAEDGGPFDQPDRGIAYVIEGKTWVNNHAHVLRPRGHARLRYLFRVLENYDVTPWITGSTRAKLTKAGASEIQIPLPPLNEQKRIAGILDAADALRAKRREALAQLDTLIQSTFLDMFGDPVINPMGWEMVNGGRVSRRLTVGIVVKPASYYQPTGVPAIRSLNVRTNKIEIASLVYVSAENNEGRLKKTRVWKDDVLLVRSGQPGTAAVVPAELDGVNAIDILILTPDQHVAHPVYLSNYFNSAGGKRMVLGAQRGQIQKHLNVGSLRSAPIPLPPLDLQCRFAAIVESVEHQKASQRAHLAEVNTLFAALQSRAFRGDL